MKTIVTMLLDESGSMTPHAADVRKTFGQYVNGLKKEGVKGRLNLLTFDDPNGWAGKNGQPLVRVVRDAVRIDKTKGKLTEAEYTPNGGTPLYDAIGSGIRHTEEFLKSKKKDWGVLFVVHTDGCENASKEFSQTEIVNLIKQKEKDGWTFVYLGEDQDAWSSAHALGITTNVVNVGSAAPLRGAAMRDLATVTTCYASNAASASSRADVKTDTLYEDAGLDAEANAS